MKILGISAFYHDSAAAIIENDRILAAAQEERFSRIKHDPDFPEQAVKYCLEYAGVSLSEIDAVVFYDKPLLKFERLLETYYAFSPKGLPSFIRSIPIWLKEKLFLKRLLHQRLSKIQAYDKKNMRLLFTEHHLSHAASAFYPSGFEEAAILTIDGVGEWATASISIGKNNNIEILKELHFPHSLGLLYSAFTYYLGFKVNSGEYKLMGLAPFGNKSSTRVEEFMRIIKDKLITIKEDGSIQLHLEYFDYAIGQRMVKDKKWEGLFGFKRRNAESPLLQEHCDLGLAIQLITEEIVIKMAKHTAELTSCKNLCMAGGVALNCVANGKLMSQNIFENIYFQPSSGDAGGALGAALAANYIYFKQKRVVTPEKDLMEGAYLGPEYAEVDVQILKNKFNAPSQSFSEESDLVTKTAAYIGEGKIVGWMQGRMEFGPRALGARSIIADPTNPEMQKKLNLKIKFRESFRPFAPAVLEEDASEFFELDQPSPYMMLVRAVKEKYRNSLPDDFESLSIKDKLYFERSSLPAITHVDFSARIQTVSKSTNKKFWELINAFKMLSGKGMLINTSFNVRGEPIVNTPEEAYRCFMRTEMDVLVVENHIFIKSEQPEWQSNDNWKEEFELD